MGPAWLVVSWLPLLSHPAPAQSHDGFRCGGYLVELGDLKPQVAAKCGEPTYRESRSELRIVRGGYITVVIDEWTYALGPGTFPRLLAFENGRLARVIALSR